MKKKPVKLSIKSLFLVFFILVILLISNMIKEGVDANANTENIQEINTTTNTIDKFTVCIDAGHGGYDVGAVTSSNISEKDITLKIALKVGALLEKEGVNVLYTRTSDKVSWPSNNKLDIRARVKVSNEAKADAFVSIHCNSSINSSDHGVETWCRFPNSDGEKLAESLQKELISSNYSTDRGLKYESNGSLGVLRLNNSVSALIELGFLSNSSDIKFITSESGQDVCANSIAKGILNYKSYVNK